MQDCTPVVIQGGRCPGVLGPPPFFPSVLTQPRAVLLHRPAHSLCPTSFLELILLAWPTFWFFFFSLFSHILHVDP